MASRISVIADASANMFKAMHNLRTDRSTTNRLLQFRCADGQRHRKISARSSRGRNAGHEQRARLLDGIEFVRQQTLVPEFDRLFKTLTTLQKEFWDAWLSRRPRAVRRWRRNIRRRPTALLETLDKLSGTLAADVNHQDAMIDQLLTIKQIAWLLRNTARRSFAHHFERAGRRTISPEIHVNLHQAPRRHRDRLESAGIDHCGNAVAAALASAMAATKTAYFEPQYLDLARTPADGAARRRKAGTDGEPVEPDHGRTARRRRRRRRSRARRRPRRTRATQYSAAQRSLVMQLALLVAALALTFGAMMLVTRRVIKPLHNMRDAMLKVAAGDLTVDTGYAAAPGRDRRAGRRAGNLQAAGRSTSSGSKRRSASAMPAPRRASRRSRAYVGEFESMVRQTLGQLGDASGQMRTTSAGLSAVSRQTNERVEVAEKASGEASMSVESVAAASEELSASINDISQQAAHAAGIASRAVGQARETDGTVQGLAQIGRTDRRGRRPDQHHRRPDQSAGAERHHRGGARR